MRIVWQQTILMKYALFVIFEKVAKFLIVVCCKLIVMTVICSSRLLMV